VAAVRRRPTRRDLLVVIGRLQDLVGEARARHMDDRDRNGYERGQEALERAHELCIEVLGMDDPVTPSGPWAEG